MAFVKQKSAVAFESNHQNTQEIKGQNALVDLQRPKVTRAAIAGVDKVNYAERSIPNGTETTSKFKFSAFILMIVG